MYGIVGAVVIIKNKQQTSPEPKHRFRPADSTRGGPAPSPALPLAPPPQVRGPRPSLQERAHRAPHLEERRLRVHGAIALSVAEVEHAGEAGAIRPHVGAHAVAVVAVELPAVGLRAESAGTGVPPEKLPLTLGA